MEPKLIDKSFLRALADRMGGLEGVDQLPDKVSLNPAQLVIPMAFPGVKRWAVNSNEGIALDGLSTYSIAPVAASATPHPNATDIFDDFFTSDIRILNMPFLLRYLDVATVAAEIAANARLSFDVFVEPIGTSGLDQGTLSGTANYIGRGTLFALQAGQLDYIINPVSYEFRIGSSGTRSLASGYLPAGWRCGITLYYSTTTFNTARNFPVGTGFRYQICGIKGPQGVPLPQ